MYHYVWDAETGGYTLTTETGRFVANEIRPVFAEELLRLGMADRLSFNHEETGPILWAQKNAYIYRGEKIAQCNKTQYGKPIDITCFFEGTKELSPVDVDTMLQKNAGIMDALVWDTKRRTKELYDADIRRCDTAYIAFSGGKDSVVLLDFCDRVLPKSVPVIFSDTDMELPDTYVTWERIQQLYPSRTYIAARADAKALDNWKTFGPPSRTIRWCCSIHKSTPALIELKARLKKSAIRVMAFVGVRAEESISRSSYADANDGIKNASQMNRMPLLDWGAHELWLYTLQHKLYINRAYRLGIPRVGCAMCPESTEKYVWLIDTAYPGLIDPYADVIQNSSKKTFATAEERREFMASQGWQARKSGVVLNDTLPPPIESTEGLTTTFRSAAFERWRFDTWIKPLGRVTIDPETRGNRLKLPRTLDEGIPFAYHAPYAGGGEFTIHFRNEDERLAMLPPLRKMLKKVTACVSCRACESECIHGALTCVDGRMQINEERCVHCKKCFDNIDNGCWRYKSMYKSEKENKNKISNINCYNNFGLRERDSYLWISTLVEMRENFFPWSQDHPLGKKMVDAASSWFRQARLIHEDRTPTLLVDLFEKHGGDCRIGWELLWLSLANNAILIKWFITATKFGTTYSTERLSAMLAADYPSLGSSTIKGGLSALRDMISKSPIGEENGMVTYEMKGRAVAGVTRIPKEVYPLTVLYGLYLNAFLADLGTFTVSGLMESDIDSRYISPIVAFGIPVTAFKHICEGLCSRYPDYIATTFTHGNDEVRVFPDKFTPDHIIELAIREA